MSAGKPLRVWARENVSSLVLAPTGLLALVFVYGFIALTIYLSLSESRILPDYTFAGLAQWDRLWSSRRWWTAITNLVVFGALFIAVAISIGMALAILLDQRIINTLRRWTVDHGELSQEQADRIFSRNRSDPKVWSQYGVVHHVDGHANHMHVRVRCPD